MIRVVEPSMSAPNLFTFLEREVGSSADRDDVADAAAHHS